MNAVGFIDETSNIIFSGSDNGIIKVKIHFCEKFFFLFFLNAALLKNGRFSERRRFFFKISLELTLCDFFFLENWPMLHFPNLKSITLIINNFSEIFAYRPVFFNLKFSNCVISDLGSSMFE